MMRKIIIVFSFLLSVFVPLCGQTIVESHLDTASMLVGEQVQLQLKAIVPQGQKVNFPTYTEKHPMAEGVEVIRESPIDTAMLNNGKTLQLKRKYTITSFDSAMYRIVPYVVVGEDTVKARNIVGLKVSNVPVDTVHYDQFKPAYGPVDMPFEWNMRYLWLCILVFMAVVLISVFTRRILDRKPMLRKRIIPPPTPSHQVALQQLQHLSEEEDNGSDKDFYMRLSDIIEQYMEQRFGVNLKELTSNELLQTVKGCLSEAQWYKLQEFFALADLVKFAKYSVLAEERKSSLDMCVRFVKDTLNVEEERQPATVVYETVRPKMQKMIYASYWVGLLLCIAVILVISIYSYVEIFELFLIK